MLDEIIAGHANDTDSRHLSCFFFLSIYTLHMVMMVLLLHDVNLSVCHVTAIVQVVVVHLVAHLSPWCGCHCLNMVARTPVRSHSAHTACLYQVVFMLIVSSPSLMMLTLNDTPQGRRLSNKYASHFNSSCQHKSNSHSVFLCHWSDFWCHHQKYSLYPFQTDQKNRIP